MPGHLEKRANGDGSVSWRAVVPVGYGRHAGRIVRSVRAVRDTKNPPQRATDLLAQIQSQAEGGVQLSDGGVCYLLGRSR
jgi:hypothetical protein